MKSFFKRSAISLAVLGLAGSAYAAAPANAAMYNSSSWSPQFTGVFIGVEGLDLRPMNGDLDYVTIAPNAVGQAFSTHNIDTTYDWSWRVFGGIKFTDNDDITVSWMQMRTSDSDSVATSGTIPPANLGVASPRWLFTFPWTSVSGKVTFDLDDVYAVWGHTVNFNNPWSLRFAAGVEYAKIDSDMTVTADGNSFANIGVVGFESDSDMKGFGPRVEMDATYHLPYGFALFANANAALLVAKRDISLDPTVASVLVGTSETDFFASDYSTRHVVVPKFGARLGASYTYVWGQGGGEGACRTTSLTVDAGWQVESYIHAIERPEGSFNSQSIEALTQSSSSSSFATKTSNFGDSGLFVGVKLGMDWM